MNAHRRRTVAAATVVVACTLAAAAAARLGGNAASYADPTGDGASAPDISTVSVTNDDRGDVTVRATLANRQPTAEDWVTLFLDVDGVEDEEGNVQAEYAVVADSEGGHFLRLGAGEPQDVPSFVLTNFASSFANGVLTLRVNQRDLKDTTALNLWLRTGTEVDESFDDAPDGDAVWEYSVISPTLYVLAFSPPTAARAGQTVRGLLSVRGLRRDTARVGCTGTIGGRRVQAKADWFTLSLAGGGTTSVVKADPRCAWAIPKTARGKLMRGTMTVLQDGLQVSRSFSVRVR